MPVFGSRNMCGRVGEVSQPRSHTFKPLITSNDVVPDLNANANAATLLVACMSPDSCRIDDTTTSSRLCVSFRDPIFSGIAPSLCRL
jgi:hypothetical protein